MDVGPERTGRLFTPQLLPLALVVTALASPAAAQPDSRPAAQPDALAEASAELRSLYQADQADRSSAPSDPEGWRAISERDRQRRERVLELLRSDRVHSADDLYHAAMVLQHGESAEDVLLAHILATAAGFQGHENGRWLSAAALDRYLHRTDQPQRLGTQYVKDSPDEPWSQGAYERWLPDSLRELYGVPPLAEQEKQVEEMNGGSR
jgi:hypothetical protein